MIFSFPGQMLPDAMAAEIARVGKLLLRHDIDAIANMAVQFDLVTDNEFVKLALLDDEHEPVVVPVPNIALADFFEDPGDPLDEAQFRRVQTWPRTLRRGQKAAALQGIAGPLRAPVEQEGLLNPPKVRSHLDTLQYRLLIDLIASAWGLDYEETSNVFQLTSVEDYQARDGTHKIQRRISVLTRAALDLHEELYLSKVLDYEAWFRTSWRSNSPIGTASPAEALIRGGLSGFQAVTSFLEFERMVVPESTAE